MALGRRGNGSPAIIFSLASTTTRTRGPCCMLLRHVGGCHSASRSCAHPLPCAADRTGTFFVLCGFEYLSRSHSNSNSTTAASRQLGHRAAGVGGPDWEEDAAVIMCEAHVRAALTPLSMLALESTLFGIGAAVFTFLWVTYAKAKKIPVWCAHLGAL
eukprot:COSAG05_NODE_87_length_20404_cov_42.272051_20_plen_158_part_00